MPMPGRSSARSSRRCAARATLSPGAPPRATLTVSGTIAGNLLVLAVVVPGDTDELFVLALDARTGALRWKRALFCDQGDDGAAPPILATGPDAVYVLSCRGVIAS